MDFFFIISLSSIQRTMQEDIREIGYLESRAKDGKTSFPIEKNTKAIKRSETIYSMVLLLKEEKEYVFLVLGWFTLSFPTHS